jgi:hypothetical protein
MDEHAWLAERFEEHRIRLGAVAQQDALGSLAEADVRRCRTRGCVSRPPDVWAQANTNLDSAAGEFVVYNVEPTGDPGFYYVDLTTYLADGTSFERRTMFHWEGYWAHWLTQEEMSMFDGALA